MTKKDNIFSLWKLDHFTPSSFLQEEGREKSRKAMKMWTEYKWSTDTTISLQNILCNTSFKEQAISTKRLKKTRKCAGFSLQMNREKSLGRMPMLKSASLHIKHCAVDSSEYSKFYWEQWLNEVPHNTEKQHNRRVPVLLSSFPWTEISLSFPFSSSEEDVLQYLIF